MFRDMRVPYYTGNYCSAIRLKFEIDGFSMLIMLPKKLSKSSLRKLETKLCEGSLLWDEILHKSTELVNVEVYLPRFKLRWSKEIVDDLSQCGIGNLFSKTTCDLSGKYRRELEKIAETRVL